MKTNTICKKLTEQQTSDINKYISITLFDRTIISITLKGVTKLMSCREEL